MRLRFLLFSLSIISFTAPVLAQSNLNKEISIGSIDHQRISTILQKIAAKGQFTFAYNNRTVPADSLMSMTDFHGTVYSFLNNTFGNDYEFKEVPGYIVLRHAPNKMSLSASVEEVKGQQLVIRGQVVNLINKQPLGQVSVYEKNQLVSTLTDDKGQFELKLTSESGSILLTATRENYRDTSLFFLQEVKVSSTKTKKHYKYYPDETIDKFGKSFAGLFISSRQIIQNMNLGGFFALSPYQVSLTPGLSSHGLYSGQVVDHFSLNLLGGYTGGVQGAEIAGLFNIDRRNVTFFQAAGLFNIVGGDMNGIQMAGLYNRVLNTADGIQMAGIVNSASDVRGLQMAGLYNRVLNKVDGVQIAGIANSADEVKGWQLAGLFNVAKKVKGVQLAGLFNVADSSDYPIALVNFIKNGRKSLALSYDESNYAHIDFRSGGRVLYGLIGVGYNFNYSNRYAFDVGFGAHIINHSLFTLDGEYGYEALADFKKDPDQVSTFKLLPGLKLSKTVLLFAGPTINVASYPADDPLTLHGWQVHKYVNGNNVDNIYAGITGGLQFTW